MGSVMEATEAVTASGIIAAAVRARFSLRAVKMIQPKLVIPMHYNTFPPIVQDPDAFAAAVQAAGFQAKVLHPGETLTI